ncbi:MAG TPA: hypothetical protein VFP48_01310 [Steroidobacteraceae bacterium]|nr:hypothetical protein [Steroidobacteraceae bacterium]
MQRRTRRPFRVAWLLSIVAAGAAMAETASPVTLPALPLDSRSVTVSGISSGGAMAVQFHTAHSRLVQGAGVLAAPPYLCAENNVALALGRCMKGGEPIPVERLLQRAEGLARAGAIDPVEGMAQDRVWLYRGAADPHVRVEVADALERYYLARTQAAAVQRVERPGAGHNFPVATAGAAPCSASEPPYLASCEYDGARRLLEHLYGPLAPGAATDRLSPLVAFDQRPFATAAGSVALADQGWLYVPAACGAGAGRTCRLHVVFHGCKQGVADVGDAFARRAGYLEVAEANRIVVLFPQVKPTLLPLNPLGCWDWWGYEGEDYATRDGRQVAAVRAMIGALLAPAPSAGGSDARSP